MTPLSIDPGLAGLVIADTRISQVDGASGRLVLRGRSLADVADHATVEALAGLLQEADPDALRTRWATDRTRAFALLPELHRALAAPDGMDALRGSLAAMPADLHPTAAAAVCFAAWTRLQRGLEPLAPDPSHDQATSVWHMVTGTVDPARADALRTYLVTVADHGLNASTFTARVVASTGSDDLSAVVAAIGALKGPLHGGAPGPVLDMLDAIGTADRAEGWIRAELAAGRRIMGLGHRVYRVRDPRAAVLEAAVERLETAGLGTERLALARAVERTAVAVLTERKPDRPLRANVEFATALLLDAIGWDRTWFAPTFAVARTVGWLAHTAEQRATGKLIRPSARYVGPALP